MNVHPLSALFPFIRVLFCGLLAVSAHSVVLGQSQDVGTGTNPSPTAIGVVNSDLDGKTMGYVLLAELSARNGDIEGAVAYYYQIAKEVKRDELFEKAVQYAFVMRSADHAIDAGRAWTQTMPTSAKAAVYWFTIMLRTQPKERSYDALKAALEKSDAAGKNALLRELPRWYGATAPTPATLKALERVLAPHRAAPQTAVYATVAMARLQLGASDTEAALALFQAAAALDARHPETIGLAAALLPLRPEILKRWFIAQIEQHGDSATVLNLVRWQAEQEGAGPTLAMLESAWRKHPNNPAVGLLLARYQIAALRWNKAKAMLERARQLDLDYSKDTSSDAVAAVSQEIRLRLAEVELIKNPQGSIEEWLEGVSLDRFDSEVLRLRLLQLVGKGELEQAALALAAAPDRTQDNPLDKAHLWDEVLRAKGRYPEALTALNERLAAAPNDKALQIARATLLEELGDTRAALLQLRQVVQDDPSDPLALNALGYTLADHGQQLLEAKELISQANKGQPNNAMIMDSLGWVEYRLGHLEDAAHWLNRAYERDPHPEIGAHLGEVLWMQGQKDRAIKVFQDAFDNLSPYPALVKTLKRLGVTLP